MPKLIDTDALYRATLDVFAERGYDALTTREVAGRAHINEVTIYRRFGTKAALVQEAINASLSTAPFADLAASDDLEADLATMIEAFQATTHAFGGAVIALLVEASRHPELRPAMAPLQANLERALAILATHQQHGQLARDNPSQQLLLLISPLVAAGLWSRAGSAPPIQPDTSNIVTGFLDGHRI